MLIKNDLKNFNRTKFKPENAKEVVDDPNPFYTNINTKLGVHVHGLTARTFGVHNPPWLQQYLSLLLRHV